MYLQATDDQLKAMCARGNLTYFAKYMNEDLHLKGFHLLYYKVLDMFAHGRIKKLIVTMPPQHGKSQGSSRFLPAYLLGINPELNIVIGSYALSLSRDFNQDVQKIIDSERYNLTFPKTTIARSEYSESKQGSKRNTNSTEIINHTGSLRVVGRGGALTGKSVDISILDDVYKDYEEANSPVIRESAWKWYTTVVRTRLHNDSQELIVFTRWHKDDIVGRLEKTEKIVDLTCAEDIENLQYDEWLRINFEAIKVSEKTDVDGREIGEPLWAEKHSLKKLLANRKLDKVQFQCLYQGNPQSAEGKLYGDFKTYVDVTDYGEVIGKGNYTDTADTGSDFLCSICYTKVRSNETDESGNAIEFICVTDVYFNDDPIEVTTADVPRMMNRNGTTYANIEANNGGHAFSKLIEPRTTASIRWFPQKQNKEARIITNAGMVNSRVVMPYNWNTRFPLFYSHVTEFLRVFGANAHDDGVDVLTGIIETEINTARRGIRRKN